MKQFFSEYTEWEDFKNGMYVTSVNNFYELEIEAIKILTNESLFFSLAKSVISNWIISSKVNLTNTSYNRRAWVGQASCCYGKGIPEVVTRSAWSKLSDSEKIKANNIADKIIKSFEVNYEKSNNKIHY